MTSPLRTPLLVAAVAASLLAAGRSLAQPAESPRLVAVDAGDPGLQPLTLENRAAEFRALSEDVAALEAQLGIYKRVARLVAPSVVHIEARPIREHRIRSGGQEAGSGVIVHFRGKPYILTNRHVIKHSSPSHIRVQLVDGRPFRPDRLWSDSQTDVAVMSITASDSVGLAPAVLGDSSRLEIGEQVLAFGSPFGLSHSVTRGIVSAKGRYNLDLGDGEVELQNFLQTDAAINPGNSGGPLVNLRGEVVGLNTAIASSSGGNEGIGFSIPINLATRIAGQLIENGEATRGYLGVEFDPMFNEQRARAAGLPRLFGARITVVKDDSPAQQAALREDDILLTYNGTPIEDFDHLFNLVNLTEVGDRVDIELIRNGARIHAMVPIGRRPPEDAIR
ncbi:putative serine protease HtrA [Botrimarina colliarenosi]|uniref:Putative serine protease HtrA n=1 Tax=Botrimarina colliarenosi TaxID=2528001 RepID=A0A5C6AK62_9BACT|nr:trypsin-like peptidase domain-containing protein [Botrimarina colliarenosi]TWT99638.1 putative serine protease HtrA [Botrimarina colliarenosi]